MQHQDCKKQSISPRAIAIVSLLGVALLMTVTMTGSGVGPADDGAAATSAEPRRLADDISLPERPNPGNHAAAASYGLTPGEALLASAKATAAAEGGTGGLQVAVDASAAEEAEPCVDKNNRCVEWAAAGECVKNANFMTSRCAKACGQCRRSATPADPKLSGTAEAARGGDVLVDSNTRCPEWAAKGECVINPTFMLSHCRHACASRSAPARHTPPSHDES